MGLIPQEMSTSVDKMQLGYIRPYHREIARRLILGQTQSEISRELGMSTSRLSIVVNSPLFKQELKRIEDERDRSVMDVTRTLQELSPLALETIERTMYSARSQRLRFEAAETILDRAGFGGINKSLNTNVNLNTQYTGMSDEELRKMVEERVSRMRAKEDEFSQAIKEATTIELEYDQVQPEADCSDSEQQFPENTYSGEQLAHAVGGLKVD